MNFTFRCIKCKYPYHLESEDLEGKTAVSFTCSGCGTFQEVKLQPKIKIPDAKPGS